MEEITKVMLNLPKEVDYELNQFHIELKRKSVRITKVDLIIKLMRIGLMQERKELQKPIK